MTASVAIPAAAYQVLYILNVTQENTGPVTVSGAINRDLVTNLNQPIEPSYLVPGMALLCIDTGQNSVYFLTVLTKLFLRQQKRRRIGPKRQRRRQKRQQVAFVELC